MMAHYSMQMFTLTPFQKRRTSAIYEMVQDLETFDKPLVPEIAKLTTVTKLAMKAHEKQTTYTDACKNVPSKYHAFLDVSKTSLERSSPLDGNMIMLLI